MLPSGVQLVVALLFALLAGCGDDGPKSCVLSANDDGSTTMRCPDGSSVRLPSTDEEQPAGGIRGTARFFGRQDHAGIRVEVRGHPDLFALTGPDGSFAIDDVPSGHHAVEFTATGYEDEKAEELMVLPGAWATEDAELEIGRRVLSGGGWELIPSPSDHRFLAHRPEGDLHLVDPLALSARFLGAEVQSATFSPDGAWVIFKSGKPNSEGTGKLSLHVVGNGATRNIADAVYTWRLTPDGDTFAIERRVEGRATLETWHEPSGRRAGVAQNVFKWQLSGDGGALLASVQLSSGMALVTWDVAAAGGTGLGDVAPWTLDRLPDFSPDHRSFVYQSVFGDALLWDGFRQETRRLDQSVIWHAFDADGDQLLFIAGDESALVHWDVDTGSRFEIATAVQAAAITPDGSTAAYVRFDGAEFVLSSWDRESRASTRLATFLFPPIALLFDPAGRELFLLDWNGALAVWRDGALDQLSARANAFPLFAPNGSSFLFLDGLDLLWADAAGGEPVLLGSPVSGYPVAWWKGGEHLLFLTGRDSLAPTGDQLGDAWLFRPENRHLERVATTTRLGILDFLDDGSVLGLHRYDIEDNFRGELVRAGVPIATGAKDGYSFTSDGGRVLFVTDAIPVRAEAVLALWEPERLEPRCPEHPDGEMVERGGIVPVAAWVKAQLVGDRFLAWVAEPEDEEGHGLFVAHFPNDLPPPPEPVGEIEGPDASDTITDENHE